MPEGVLGETPPRVWACNSVLRRAAASSASVTASGPSVYHCRAPTSSNTPLCRAATSLFNASERVAVLRMASVYARARSRRKG
jgi:hypothetical protein